MCVDGGVIDNLPIDLVNETLPDPAVTAISVGRPCDLDVGAFAADGVVSRSRRPTMPNQLVNLLTSFVRKRSDLAPCDHLIEPDVGDASLFDASQFAEAMERGRQAGRDHLARRRPAGGERDPGPPPRLAAEPNQGGGRSPAPVPGERAEHLGRCGGTPRPPQHGSLPIV